MPGTRIFTVSLLLFLAAATLAAAPEYFPLQPGNQWVYRSSLGDAVIVEVVEAKAFDNVAYAFVRGFFGRDAWLRLSGDGTLYAYDPAVRTETVWAAFEAPEGVPYSTGMHQCNSTASVGSHTARYKGPVGELWNVTQVNYGPGPCADAGITREMWLPYVGLLQRTETTIGGLRTYDLVYSRTGGVTVLSDRENAFALTLDRAVYYANLMPPVDPKTALPELLARATLRVKGIEPVRLTFPSSQTYDLVLRNERGETVYKWSEGKAFLDVIRTEDFGPGERNWVVQVRLADKEGKPLAQGRYVAEFWLTTAGAKAYSASAGFEIRHAF